MKKRSFSLIEVVLACTVLILFLMSGIILYGTGMRNIVIAKHRLEATYLANQKIEEYTATRDSSFFVPPFAWPSCTSDSKDLDIHFDRACNIVNDPIGTDTRRIEVTVSWNEFNQDYSTTAYKYLTKWQN